MRTVQRHATFPTSIGPCVIAWSDDGVCGLALPGADGEASVRAATRSREGFLPSDPPGWIGEVIGRVQRLLEGEAVSFADVPLALGRAAPFEQLVYAQALAIPHGETRTYGALARAIGQPGASRAVGRALGRNPVPIIVPCHRILAADGRSGGFSAPGGVSTKMKLLDLERARRSSQPGLFDSLSWAAHPRGAPSRAGPDS